MKQLNIAYILTTYNKISEVKGQMEIIRNIWKPHFARITIFHEYNGPKELYPKKYLEDHLSVHPTLPHYIGAADLINHGFIDIFALPEEYDYIVVASGDTWVYNPEEIVKIFALAQQKKYELISSLWAGPFLATEFFIITPNLAKKIFPLQYQSFVSTSAIIKLINDYTPFQLVEYFFTRQVMKYAKRSQIGFIPRRKIFIPYINRYATTHFYASHHNPIHRKRSVSKDLLHFLHHDLSKTPTLRKLIETDTGFDKGE